MSQRPTPEATRRDGVPCRLIQLADGHQWGFALPSIRLRPRVMVGPDVLGRPTECICVDACHSQPPEVESLYHSVQAASENGSTEEQYTAFFTLAAALLRRAHEIDLDDACELLAVPCERLPDLVRAVMEVASSGERPPTPDSCGDWKQ
jgi:hypothetical protein